MVQLTTKLSLSGPNRCLVELMQKLNFGRIENLTIQNGQPVFDKFHRIVQKVKIGGENGPRPELTCDDFLLKKQTIELLGAISDLGDGLIRSVDVRYGLPFAAEIELMADTMTRVPPGGRRG